MQRTVLPTLVFFLLFPFCVSAWPDGRHDGFITGLTTGYGNIGFRDSTPKGAQAIMAGAQIGAGFGDSFITDFKVRYRKADFDAVTYQTWTFCADLMFFPWLDSGFFLTAGFGPAIIDSGDDGQTGTTYYAGLGYELARWIFLTFEFGRADFADKKAAGITTLSLSLIVY